MDDPNATPVGKEEDLYKPVHRHYPGLLAADVRTAGALIRPDTARWQAAVEAHVRGRHFDAVVESALADPDDFRASSLVYRAAGHRIEVVTVATAEALSQLGIVDRFLTEAANGQGRYVSWENHDTCAQGLPATLAVIEKEQLADRVTVVRRDGTVLYANELTPEGIWRRRPAADRASAGGAVAAVDCARDCSLPSRSRPCRPARTQRTGR